MKAKQTKLKIQKRVFIIGFVNIRLYVSVSALYGYRGIKNLIFSIPYGDTSFTQTVYCRALRQTRQLFLRRELYVLVCLIKISINAVS